MKTTKIEFGCGSKWTYKNSTFDYPYPTNITGGVPRVVESNKEKGIVIVEGRAKIKINGKVKTKKFVGKSIKMPGNKWDADFGRMVAATKAGIKAGKWFLKELIEASNTCNMCSAWDVCSNPGKYTDSP